MQSWTTEMWQIAGISVIVGLILGYIVMRFTKGTVKKQVQTENELKEVKAQLESKTQQLEKHFSESAALLKNIAKDYQKLYQHLANSSAELLPEKTATQLFTQPLLTEQTDKEQVSTDDQPRDYSEGSSGILKAEK